MLQIHQPFTDQLFISKNLKRSYSSLCPDISSQPQVKKIRLSDGPPTPETDVTSETFMNFVIPLLNAYRYNEGIITFQNISLHSSSEIRQLCSDLKHLVIQIGGNPIQLRSYDTHTSRIKLHLQSLNLMIKHNARREFIAIQCNVLWRLNFISNFVRSHHNEQDDVDTYFPNPFPDRKLLTAIQEMRNLCDVWNVISLPNFQMSLKILIENTHLLKPRTSHNISSPSSTLLNQLPSSSSTQLCVNKSSSRTNTTFIDLQNAREHLKYFIMTIEERRTKLGMTELQIQSVMKCIRDGIEPMILMDRIIFLFYVNVILHPNMIGIPWISSRETDNQHHTLFECIHNTHKGMFPISNQYHTIITKYFPHHAHLLQPCVPARFSPEGNQWQKQYVNLAEKVGIFWSFQPQNETTYFDVNEKKINELED
jgi:hypothetical protein